MPAVFACGSRSTLGVTGVEGPRLDGTGEGSDGATADVDAKQGSREGGTLCAYIEGPVASCDTHSIDDPVQICPAEAPFCTNYLEPNEHYGCCTSVGGACTYDPPGILSEPNWPGCIFPCCPSGDTEP
jgi:hypothetical protein